VVGAQENQRCFTKDPTLLVYQDLEANRGQSAAALVLIGRSANASQSDAPE
jgi:hypothetical protein